MSKPFLCDLCKKRFRSMDGALDHIHTLHKRRKRQAKIINLDLMKAGAEKWMFRVEKQLTLKPNKLSEGVD